MLFRQYLIANDTQSFGRMADFRVSLAPQLLVSLDNNMYYESKKGDPDLIILYQDHGQVKTEEKKKYKMSEVDHGRMAEESVHFFTLSD